MECFHRPVVRLWNICDENIVEADSDESFLRRLNSFGLHCVADLVFLFPYCLDSCDHRFAVSFQTYLFRFLYVICALPIGRAPALFRCLLPL